MTDDYGSDLDCQDDIHPLAKELEGDDPLVVAQAIYHRLITPRGGLIGDPDYGFCLADLVQRGMTPVQIRRLPSQVEAEILKDDRVQSCEVSATWSESARTITLRIEAVLLDGSDFSMVTSSNLTSTVLQEYQES